MKNFSDSNVGELKKQCKIEFNLSGNIIIRSGSDDLEDSKLIDELYNTHNAEYNALEVIVEENGKHKMVVFKYFNLYTPISDRLLF